MPDTGAEWFALILMFILVSYPIIGGLGFLVSSLYYFILGEHKDRPRYLEHGEPFVTVLIPAHNEEASIESTIRYLEGYLNYPPDKYEIMVVDDASNDRTGEILATLQEEFDNLRVVTIVNNRGKAHGLNVAVAHAKGDFLLCNDADTKPHPDALWQYLSFFERKGGHNLGAVTGNMLAANRTTLTAEAQQNELNSIIGLIKRGQLAYGALFAFSGANTMYRRQAVLDIGGWHAEQPTEDISIAWDLQTAGWRATFAPHIRFYLDVPEKVKALIKQRHRWSSGGVYVLASKGPKLMRHPFKNFRMMPVIFDFTVSVLWSVVYWFTIAMFILLQLYQGITLDWERFWHTWYMAGILVSLQMIVGLLQLAAASFYNDRGKTMKYVLFGPLYILAYWMVNTWTVAVELIPSLKKVWSRRDGGTWKSPERSGSLQQAQDEPGGAP